MSSSNGATLVLGRLALPDKFESKLSTAFYIYTLRNDWKDPTTWVRITKILAMVVNMLSALLAVSTAHAVNLKSKKIGFGLFSGFAVAGCTFDLLYFGLLVDHKGFISVCEGTTNCVRKHALIGFSVYVFVAVIVRLYAFLVLWHYDIKWNQAGTSPTPPAAAGTTPAAGSATPATPAKPATTASSLPKFFRGIGERKWRGQWVRAAMEDDDDAERTGSGSESRGGQDRRVSLGTLEKGGDEDEGLLWEDNQRRDN
ncbi:hypothetical protein T439DRAFT_382865 [Meredithblackwellia eburnea MCA 4105]